MRDTSRRAWLAYWSAASAILIGSIALRAPALNANLYADDWDHYAIEKQIYPVRLPIWDMFNWVGGQDAQREALLDSGRLPWWSSRNLQLSVFRPLASLLAHFDYSTLDGVYHPGRLHLHTLLWWSLLLMGVAALTATVLPLPVAAISTLLYAVDDGFIVPFAWVANRSQIVALVFVVWALWFHVRGQYAGSWRMHCAAAILVGLALCAGEHALAPLSYVFVAGLYGRGTLWSRVRRLIPIAALVATYVVVREVMGYGIAGSGVYIDPLTEPLRYLFAFRTRVTILLAELVFSIPCEWSHGAPLPPSVAQLLQPSSVQAVELCVLASGIAAGALITASLLWLRTSDDRCGERSIEWLVVGALVSLLPVGGVIAAGRMTPAPAIGFDCLLAYGLWRALATVVQSKGAWIRVLHALIAILVSTVAFLVPARRSRDGAHYMNGITNAERRWIERASFGFDNLAGRHVFVLSAHDLASQMAIPFILHAAGRTMPASARLLSPRGDNAQVLTRLTTNSFELALAQQMPPSAFNGSVYRSDADAMHTGDKFSSTYFEVSVLDTRHGQPTRLRLDFSTSLDNQALVFMVATENRLSRLPMPRNSEHVVIAPAGRP